MRHPTRSLRLVPLVPLVALLVAGPAHAGGTAPAKAPAKASGARIHVAAGAGFVRRTTPKENAQLHAVLKVEERWLAATTPQEVAPLLASDFHHPSATGELVGKAAYLKWLAGRRHDRGHHRRFSRLQIRLLAGTVALVNGRVDLLDRHHHLLRQSVFTDVLRLAHGHWKAVSAQETPVDRRRH